MPKIIVPYSLSIANRTTPIIICPRKLAIEMLKPVRINSVSSRSASRSPHGFAAAISRHSHAAYSKKTLLLTISAHINTEKFFFPIIMQTADKIKNRILSPEYALAYSTIRFEA